MKTHDKFGAQAPTVRPPSAGNAGVSTSAPDGAPLVRSFTRQEILDYCRAWARENLADLKKENPDSFYTRFGLLYDFSTDLFDHLPPPK